MTLEGHTRRAFASALWAVSALTLGTRSATAQARASRFQPTRHSQDAWLDALPAKHRTIIDASTAATAGTALLYAYNLYAANKSDYALPERDVAVVVCLRHSGTVFAFNDAIWGKYGKTMNVTAQLADPKTKETPTTNLFYAVDYGTALTNLGVTIESLVMQGTRFAICAMATRGLAGSIAAETGNDAEVIYKELVANTIPNSRLVPAGVLAVTRAQEYGYSLVTPV